MKYLIENIFYLIKFSKAIKIWASWKNTVKKSKSENWSSLAATSLEMTWRSRSARSVRECHVIIMHYAVHPYADVAFERTKACQNSAPSLAHHPSATFAGFPRVEVSSPYDTVATSTAR